MSISDTVAANITTLYLGVIAALKVFGVIGGRSFSGLFVITVSTTVVGSILVATLIWDVSRKAMYVLSRDQELVLYSNNNKCRGGICWHGGVSHSHDQATALLSQVRFQQLPLHHDTLSNSNPIHINLPPL